ncbi:putative cytochrome P450 [Pseudovirgaria hyperparasitica]|uniref:Putative cytochrome P450 n=1 Tax=Pseudovirgaria hyperparasitica TaxID=470096 RepID=A0A6A6WAJ5_9PEZI|nr:putative cytochrome P450 [Pseudovirgaria hyperparasitica]KAF2759882.1 putative cytochrome P450 [Pseudovirgaria hyperparasitica]
MEHIENITNFVRLAADDNSGSLPGSLFIDASKNKRISGYLALSLSLIILVLLVIPSLKTSGNALVDAPVIGSKWPWFNRLEFLRDANTPIREGYRKFKSGIFKVIGNEILVIPNKYVDELRSLPEHKLSSIVANIDNFQGAFSTIDILLEGDLHTHTIQTRLTPKLGTFIQPICKEIRKSLPVELASSETQWAKHKAFDVIVRLIARNFARTAVAPMYDNPEWLAINVKYPENVFKCVILMRLVPNYLKGLAAWVIPWTWKVSWNLRGALRLVVPIVEERQAALARHIQDPSSTYEPPNDLLQWMMEEATSPRDARPDKLVHRLLVLAMASVHTTSMACAQAFFDLCEHPEYLEDLREEILGALRTDNGWKKTTLTRMRKLDSFMRESQRLNPPSLTGFKRQVMEPMTLSDGLFLPKGVHLVMPIVPIAQDESVTGYPLEFDGFRHYRRRDEPGNAHKYQFATTDKDNMHFGHGKFSCPGRFFASNTIKIILAHLILHYDFRYPEGQGRPKNVCLHEYIFPDPEAQVEFRRKTLEDPDIVAFEV